MKILVEEYAYDPEVVRNALPESRIFLTNGKVKIEYVGYYHNAHSTAEANDDFVFFLPKVVLNKHNRVFAGEDDAEGGFSPEEIIDPENVRTSDGRKLDETQLDFLYGFSVWIYRALSHYAETHPETDAVWASNDARSGAFRRKYITNTFLDVILALIRFNRENRDYFLFKVKEKHSGISKISWSRTVARTEAIMDNGAPVYLNPVGKKHTIDFDEELLVLFYSILRHVRVKYGFRVRIGMGYDLITGDRFIRYLDGYGVARLRQIKYKYFSDRDLMLWELCFAFFDKAHKANIASSGEDYLLAKSFDRVFEAMVDELLGDPQLSRHKELSDGKEIDHLYVDESLTRTDGLRTLCIADSKYYKSGNTLGTNSESVSKQFTYARGILQLNLDLFLSGSHASSEVRRKRAPLEKEGIRLQRDETTEGYDIIPNFFISAAMQGLDYDKDGLAKRRIDDGGEFQSKHFENRLFDRDTLILSHYDVNFLYVLKLYTQGDDEAQSSWREEVRCKFREEIRSLLSGRFDFYAIMPHEGVDAEAFFRENFKYTQGKVYAPYPTVDGRPVYSLALAKPGFLFPDKSLDSEGLDEQHDLVERERTDVLDLIGTSFYILEDCKLGEDPSAGLRAIAKSRPVVHHPVPALGTGVQIVSRVAGPLFRLVERSGKCPCPKDQCADPAAVSMLVLPFTQGAHVFRVKSEVGFEEIDSAVLTTGEGALFKGVSFPAQSCWVWNVELIS